MALAKFYKFVVENKTGVSVAIGEIDLIINRSKIGPTDGAINHEASAVALTNAGSIANNAFGDIGVVQDNSSGQFLEGNGHFAAIIALVPNGDLVLYISESPDNVNFSQGDRLSFPISAMTMAVTATSEQTDFRF